MEKASKYAESFPAGNSVSRKVLKDGFGDNSLKLVSLVM